MWFMPFLKHTQTQYLTFQSNISEIKSVNHVRYLTCQLIDVSIIFNEIKHELSLLEGYSLPLDKCIMLFWVPESISEDCLVVLLKQICFAEGRYWQNGTWLRKKDLFIKDSSIQFYMNKLIRIHAIIVLQKVCCLFANLYSVLNLL